MRSNDIFKMRFYLKNVLQTEIDAFKLIEDEKQCVSMRYMYKTMRFDAPHVQNNALKPKNCVFSQKVPLKRCFIQIFFSWAALCLHPNYRTMGKRNIFAL